MNEWMLGAIAVVAIVFMLGGGGWLWRTATNRARRTAPVAAEAAAKKAKAAV
jgi:hypothetical protein|tara:strand:- start:140 stop:295 length:156 start_codon:yes stop_codon:yes gene_type:complete